MGDQFNIGDIVKIKEGGVHFYAGQRGRVTHVGLPGGSRLEIKMRDNTITYASESEVTVLPKPEVGDLVKVLSSGRWQAQEGHISEIIGDRIFIDDLEHDWNRPEFRSLFIEIIEKVKPLPVRIEGKPIKPEAIKRGDKISIVSVEDSSEVKKTTILEATVDKIVKKGFNGQHFEFQTRTGFKIHNTEYLSTAVISLVSDIDKDVDFHALSLIKPNEIIGFPDEEGGIEINIAVKLDSGYWSVMLGAKKSKNMETAGLVAILKKKNVTFSIIRTTPDPLEFPVGTNVKVLPGYSASLSQGDYRVITAGGTESVIKSCGISAATHNVPNRWLKKG